MGGPINDIILCCQKKGLRTIDVRREQRAAMMAHAYSCVGASRASARPPPLMASGKVPIHPLRLCYEGREVLKRDAIGADRV